ncbi:putative abieta-7,13-dien-18-ol hydroxylase [Rosa chinensis]|uniref:Putative abieta-7,13-dien-18-ol hydroxylase n=1 Tax=Rosa chinensis TaxID=74649 RepID=A0A2P6SG67_ROSCH|nr:putative abieta-7,13-dien-18-ol hydroxylase [Rosa chinensis]
MTITTRVARECPTHRLLALNSSTVYTCDPRNIEHFLKTNFAHYSKSDYNQCIMSEILGQGIFVVNGEKWRQQKKLASFEFSTRNLVRVVFEFLDSKRVFDVQDVKVTHDFVHQLIRRKRELLAGKKDGLHATLTETLRLCTEVPVSEKRRQKPYIWGEDAEDFQPERWLDNGVFKPESPFKFVAFHAGPRTCLGKDFAYRQIKTVAMALLCFFRFKLADETGYRTMFTLHIDGTLPVLALPRATS